MYSRDSLPDAGSNGDRQHLMALATTLDIQLTRQLQRDECGDWRIRGRRGHIYADGDGYLIVMRPGSALGWNCAKQALRFCRVTQDGDDEGCLHLAQLPSTQEATHIRHAMRLKRRRRFAPDTLAKMQARASIARRARQKPNRRAA